MLEEALLTDSIFSPENYPIISLSIIVEDVEILSRNNLHVLE